MVKIRLTRGGAKKRPFYHIIVTDSRNARDGRNIERVGFYNPVATGRREARRARRRARQALGFQGRAADRQGRRAVQGSGQGRPRPDRRAARSHVARPIPHEYDQGRRILLGRVARRLRRAWRSEARVLDRAAQRDLPLPAVDPARRAGQRARTRAACAASETGKGLVATFPGVDRPRRRRSACAAPRSTCRVRRCRRRAPASTTGSTSKACAWSTVEGVRLRHRLAPVRHRRQRRAGGATASASA